MPLHLSPVTCSCSKYPGGYSAYVPFLKNKAKRLLIPYVFVMLIWVAPISAYFFNWDLSYLIKKYIFCIDPSQLWFLWMLFGVFAIIWPLKKVFIEKPAYGWVIAIILYGIGIVGRCLISNVFCVWTACQYVPLFYIGMRIREKEERGEKLITDKIPWYCWGTADLIIFVGTVIVRQHSGAVWSLMTVGLNFILHIIGAIMAWTALQALANKVNWRESKFFKILSSYSMPMYLFHQQVIYFTIIWLNGRVNPWINAGVNFVVALIVSFLISSVLMRWKATRFLIGEK